MYVVMYLGIILCWIGLSCTCTLHTCNSRDRELFRVWLFKNTKELRETCLKNGEDEIQIANYNS